MSIRCLTVGAASVLLTLSGTAWSQEAVETDTRQSSVEPTPIESSGSKAAAQPTASPKSAVIGSGNESAKAGRSLQEAMSPEEFKAAGLDKLSPEELRNLDASLKGYRQNVETKAAEKATAEAEKKVKKAATKKIDQVESRVDGTLSALTGRSIIRLEDGTVWKQASPEDRYPAQVTDHPSAFVTRTAFGWKMRISGLPEFYVDPVHK